MGKSHIDPLGHAAPVTQAGESIATGQFFKFVVRNRQALAQGRHATHGLHFGLQHGFRHRFGHEVITPGFTYIATAETVALLGAKPVYVDIDPRTYNLNPALLQAAITPRTKAIIPVSLYGQCADFDAIHAIAAQHGIPVIEDAAQSFGATYKRLKSLSLSTIPCPIFFPTKPLGCYGDGGAIFTNDDTLATALRQIARHGQDRRYHHVRVGVNSRLDTLQAAILLTKLSIFDEEMALRQQVDDRYA